MILQWLTSPEWANVVKALLHTLWQGAAIAVLLGFALRRLENPAARYRCSLAALGGVMLAGLVTWAVLNRPASPSSISPAPAKQTQPVSVPVTHDNLPPLVVNFSPPEAKPAVLPWSAWLAMFWLAGATAMIFRAGFQVAGAEKLRRSSRPLDDARIAGQLDDARRAVGLARRVRIAVTDRLTSPAVVGVLVPVLILPLSLTTTLSPEQIRFVLLHELAHIRRGDYFAGLFQLFAEALLFFNPAVWWISRQMRIEREACCDALAIELSGAPADYARTLVRVAENVLSHGPAAAPAFGDRREPSSLADRVQRMLVPGYRPKLRLTWRAMLLALFVGGGLLFLSALGTRVTVAAILSPQQRIERLEQKMTEYGAEPPVLNDNDNNEQASKVTISGRVRMADSSQLPKWVSLQAVSTVSHSSSVWGFSFRNGLFTNSVSAGTIYLDVELTNCAPTILGPLDGLATTQFENLDLVCERGFDVSLQPVDAETGKLVTDAKAATMYWLSNIGFQSHFWNSGADGSITLTHCADLPMDAVVNAPGYEIVQQRFDHVRPGEPLRMQLRRGEITTGTVVDKATGQGLADATLRVIYQTGRSEGRHQWTDEMWLLGQTDAGGRFTLNQLAGGTKYSIGVSAPGHESVVISSLVPGTKDAVIKLGPELVVRGRVIGDLDSLQKHIRVPSLYRSFNETYGNSSYGDGGWVPLRVDDSGVASFEFTNRIAARVTLTGGNYSETRNVTVPIEDWVVDLSNTNKLAAKVMPKREVVFRFQHPSGVSPAGTVEVTVPDNSDPNHLTAHLVEMAITNSEVRAQIAIGGRTAIEPKRMIGYWFDRFGENGSLLSILVTNGTGPLVIEIPLVPAGAIFASAKNADGTAAGGLFFSVEELKRSPQRKDNSPLSGGSDNVSDNAPRKWVSGPLPLGGTYQILGWRGNSFCASQPVQLTDARPDAEVELQFPPGRSFTGEVRDADGQPVRDCGLGVEFVAGNNHSFGLKSVFTDEQGKFRVDDATPGIGKYTVDVSSPGCRSEIFGVDFSRLPMVLRLQRGRTLAGRVVEAGTGYVIPDAEVRAWTDGGKLPQQTTRTDADGRFEFTTLGDGPYHLYVNGAEFGTSGDTGYKTGQTNLLLKVKPYPGGQLAPKAPTAKTSAENAGTPANAEDTKLFTRTFKVDLATLRSGLEPVGSLHFGNNFNTPDNIDALSPSEVAREFFANLGINWQQPPGKSIVYNDQLGTMVVTATKMDLDSIDKAIQVLGVPPQIHIKARFLEVPKGTYQSLVVPNLLTNSLVNNPKLETNVWQGFLSAEKFKAVFRALAANPGIVSLGEPEVTTLSGRQTQMRVTQIISVVTNTTLQAGSVVPQVEKVETGPILDVVPYVLPDGDTINLALIPSDTEFLGYAAQSPKVLPKFLVRQAAATVNLWDGQTVVLEMPEDNSGSGKLPGTKPDVQGKEQLVFVTATIVDPAGNRVHSDDELPFAKDHVPTQPTQPEQMAHPAGGRNQFNDRLRSDTDGTPPQAPPPDKIDQASQSLETTTNPGNQLAPNAPTAKTSSENAGTAVHSFKLDNAISLEDLKKTFTDAGLKMPPSVFNKINGMLLVRGSNEQLALVDRLVQKLNGSLTHSMGTNSTSFAFNDGEAASADESATNLFTRTFRVNPDVFTSSMRSISGLQTNDIGAMLQSLLNTLGVNLDSSKGKAVFFNDRSGILIVRASSADLDTIDVALRMLNSAPPQIHIKARFVEVPNGTYKKLVVPNLLTNSFVYPKLETNVWQGNVWQGFLSDEKFKTVLRALAAKPETVNLGEPEATTLSGRQTQMRVTQIISVVTNTALQGGSVVPQVEKVETGPILDVVPYVLSDGYTINLALIPSDTEFLGYAAQSPKVLPKFLVRQAVSTVNLWDSQTVVLEMSEGNSGGGGKLPGNKPDVQDKELLVFITATIVDPAGNRVHSDDELDVVPTQPTQPEQMVHPAGGRNQFNDK